MYYELNVSNGNSGVIIAGRLYGVESFYLRFYYVPTMLFMVSFGLVAPHDRVDGPN